MSKHALLFAGCFNHQYIDPRYNNDLGFMNETIQNRSYRSDNIKILYCDGRPIVYGNRTVSTESATYQNLKETLLRYQADLNPDDFLLIAISNHGCFSNGEACVNVWGTELMYQSEFVPLVSSIRARKIILLGQCFGGNLVNQQIDGSIIVSANFQGMESYGSISVPYDEFFYHFISYYSGTYPDGSPLTESNVDQSINAAYLYAKKNDMYKNPVRVNNEWFHEVPQLKCYNCDANLITL